MNNVNENRLLKEVTTPLIPILKASKVESTYALRMTPLGTYSLPQIKEFLNNSFDDHILVREESKKLKEHYHAVIFTSLYEEDVRLLIRGFLGKYFTDPPKRGDANKQYNLSETDDLELSIIYILKDASVVSISSNINIEYLDSLQKKSYKKYSKEDFAKALELLKKGFKDNGTRLDDMMIRVVQLKALYRQPVNLSYIYQLCLSYDIHNSPHKADSYVREFLSRYE